MHKQLASLAIAALLLTGCSAAPEPIKIEHEKFSVQIPGDWEKDTDTSDETLVAGYGSKDNKMYFAAYEIKLDNPQDPEKIYKSNCSIFYESWVSLYDADIATVEAPEIDYVKYENESKPHCRINYRFELQGTDAELQEQKLNSYQWEDLKVYFFKDSIIVGLFVRSGEGDSSNYFDTIYAIQDSFIPK